MATTLQSLVAHRPPEVRANYDHSVDVLYLLLDSCVPADGDGRPEGVELDYDENGFPCGVTVIGYRRNGWEHRAGDLARIAGEHLSARLPEAEVTRLYDVITGAVER